MMDTTSRLSSDTIAIYICIFLVLVIFLMVSWYHLSKFESEKKKRVASVILSLVSFLIIAIPVGYFSVKSIRENAFQKVIYNNLTELYGPIDYDYRSINFYPAKDNYLVTFMDMNYFLKFYYGVRLLQEDYFDDNMTYYCFYFGDENGIADSKGNLILDTYASTLYENEIIEYTNEKIEEACILEGIDYELYVAKPNGYSGKRFLFKSKKYDSFEDCLNNIFEGLIRTRDRALVYIWTDIPVEDRPDLEDCETVFPIEYTDYRG